MNFKHLLLGASAFALVVTGADAATRKPLVQNGGQTQQLQSGDVLGDSGGNAYGFGSVTSAGLSMPGQFSCSGSPITTTGTFTCAWATEAANTVFAGPASGSAAAPGFRGLVAADLPLISLTTGVSGVLPSANGGVDTSAWTSYSPSVSCSQATGTINCAVTAARYKTIGKTTFIAVRIGVTGTFTGGAFASVGLPNTAANQSVYYPIFGREISATGLSWAGTIAPNATTMTGVNYLNSTTVATGYILDFNGSYENQ